MSDSTGRSGRLAAEFEAVNAEVIEVVQGATAEQWRAICAAEGWSAAVVAHHVAVIQQAFVGILETLAGGATLTPRSSMAEVHESNARHAREFADVGQAETLAILQASGEAAARLIRAFDDAQIDRVAGSFGGRELTVAQVVELVVIGHARSHLASLRAG